MQGQIAYWQTNLLTLCKAQLNLKVHSNTGSEALGRVHKAVMWCHAVQVDSVFCVSITWMAL